MSNTRRECSNSATRFNVLQFDRLRRVIHEREVFEDHFISCPFCAERLQFTEDFIKAVRHAAARLLGPSAAGA